MKDNKLFAVRGVPRNTFHIEGKRNTGKLISPEEIINKLEMIAIQTFVTIPEGRIK